MLDERTEISDSVNEELKQKREAHDTISIQDDISKEAKITIAKILRKWIGIFFCIIVVASVSSTYVPFPMNIAVGIVGGVCGLVLADRYRTVGISRVHKKVWQ